MSYADDIFAELGVNVRRARKAAGVSQATLATAVGLTRTSIVNAEGGRQRLPLDVIYRIAGFLGLDPGEILPVGPQVTK